MLDFIIFLLIASPFITLLFFSRPLARKMHDHQRKVQLKHQVYKGMRDGRLMGEVIEDVQREAQR